MYLLWILQNSLKHWIVIHDKISSVNKITWISLHQILSVVKLSTCIRCSHWKMFMIFTNTNKQYFPHLIVKKTDGLPKVNKEVNFQNSIWIRFVPIQKWFSLHSTVLLFWKDYILQLSEKNGVIVGNTLSLIIFHHPVLFFYYIADFNIYSCVNNVF